MAVLAPGRPAIAIPATAIPAFVGCAGCGACLLTCPTHAIRPHGGALYARPDLCTGCGECVEVCPVDAVQLRPDQSARNPSQEDE